LAASAQQPTVQSITCLATRQFNVCVKNNRISAQDILSHARLLDIPFLEDVVAVQVDTTINKKMKSEIHKLDSDIELAQKQLLPDGAEDFSFIVVFRLIFDKTSKKKHDMNNNDRTFNKNSKPVRSNDNSNLQPSNSRLKRD
jgi:hypothetical protein